MKKHSLIVVILFFNFFLFHFTSHAQINVSGVEIPESLTYNQTESLALYGIGVREFLWLDMYVGAVFLNDIQLKPSQIIEANRPMALRLHILSSLVSNRRIIKSIKDGFDKSTNGHLQDYQLRIDEMIGFFDQEIHPNDIIDLVYVGSAETKIYRNAKHLGSIKGLDFKQALFGIWLSDNPVNASLKNQILKGI